MPTLPTNQLSPPASITDTTAFWCQYNNTPLEGTFELLEESTGDAPPPETKPIVLLYNWHFSFTFEFKSIKVLIIDTTYTSICCRSPVFSTVKLDSFSSAESAPLIVLSWTTTPIINKKTQSKTEFIYLRVQQS